MYHQKKRLMSGLGMLLIVLLYPIPATSVDAVHETTNDDTLSSSNRPRHLTSIKSIPLVANGTPVGTVILYDDSSTARPVDYLEVYNRQGDRVAVVWFDRFGIRRFAIDRAFAEGKDQTEGVFIAIVDGDYV